VKAISPSASKKGVTVAVAFAKGSPYTVEKREGSVVVSFPKGRRGEKAELVVRAAPGSVTTAAKGTRKSRHRLEGGTGHPAGIAVVGIRHGNFRRRPEIPRAADLHGLQDADITNVFRIIARSAT